MYKISYEVTIDGLDETIKTVDSIVINRSIKTLGDKAEIELPARVWNRQIKPLDKKDKKGINIVVPGKMVTIKLGYDNDLKIEFEGYLTKIITQKNTIKLQCEDALYLLRKDISDMEFPGISEDKSYSGNLQNILEYLVQQTKCKCTISCDFDVQYDKFVIHKKTGYDVLKKLHDDLKLHIFFVSHKDNIKLDETELHAHSIGSDNYDNTLVKYNFARNIEFATLEHKTEADRSTTVYIDGFDSKGHSITGKSTKTGDTLIKHTICGMDKVNLDKVANEMRLQKSYTGYDNTITTWLIPYCAPGYLAQLTDDSGEYTSGIFLVTDVKTVVASPNSYKNNEAPGCRRIITLEREKTEE